MKNISFILNTSNNTLEHVKLLLKSLKDNLRGKEHEILIFVDSDNEGTVDYLRSVKKDFYDLRIITHSVKPCVGYSRNSNLLVELAKHDVVSYLQSDMVISKDYDVAILEELEDHCILSSTRIEPPLHGPSAVTITHNFGVLPKEFQYEEFLKFSETAKQDKTVQYFFAPFTFHKKTWLDVGGYDTRFRKSREDSDLLQRLVKNGVKIKQTFKAIVYHFSCVSSRGPNWFDQNDQEAQARNRIQQMADNVELRRFVRKWGGFSHGEPLKKYDVDLVVMNAKEDQVKNIINIEPYFTRVWVDSEQVLSAIKDIVSKEDFFANYLLKFDEENWKKYSKFYNSDHYDSVYMLGKPEDWCVKFELDLASQNTSLLSNLNSLSYMVDDMETGVYEVATEGEAKATVDVRSKKCLTDDVKVTNPPFDMSLLTIE